MVLQCHIKCENAECINAISLCTKYQSIGCKYVLLRQIGQGKVATLKRTPTMEEWRNFNISIYPKTHNALLHEPWKSIIDQSAKDISTIVPKNKLDYALEMTGGLSYDFVSDLNNVSRSSYCGSPPAPIDELFFSTKSLAIVLLSHKTPMTLLNTLNTWRTSGLLDMAYERIAILNEAMPAEIAIAASFGFEVIQPKNISGAKTSRPNLFTIGGAFFYALQIVKSDYILFMENDFKMDSFLSRKDIAAELIGGAGMLERGAQVVRLMSKKYQGCGTFKDCAHGARNIRNIGFEDRKRNWYSFYCRGYPGTDPYVADCLNTPSFRCFTSWDSNWSLNAVMLKRLDMLNRKYDTPDGRLSLAEIGLKCYKRQDKFETIMIFDYKWARWKVPICISYNGLFVHEEIETSN